MNLAAVLIFENMPLQNIERTNIAFKPTQLADDFIKRKEFLFRLGVKS